MDFAFRIKIQRIRLKAYRYVILYVLVAAGDAARMAAVKNFAEQIPEDHIRTTWKLRIALHQFGFEPSKDQAAELRQKISDLVQDG